MKLQIMQVPDCPNVAVLRQRLDEALADSTPEVEVTIRVVQDADEATVVGMTGSPTLLIDGTDPFAEPGRDPSVSCRLYRDVEGQVAGAPSVAALQRVLLGQTTNVEISVQAGQCCTPETDDGPSPSVATLERWRGRATPADPAERAMHHAILGAFTNDGSAPNPVALEQAAAPFERSAAELLKRLHEQDVIRLDPDGKIRAVYPFSAVPTRHHVQLADGPRVDAMCVIDALGIPAMLGTDAVITTTAPDSGQPITVTVDQGRAVWDPATAVVFVGARAGNGPSADFCCDYLNAFTDRAAGQAWVAAHPDVPGDLVDGIDAEQLGRRIFGDLLNS